MHIYTYITTKNNHYITTKKIKLSILCKAILTYKKL